MCEPSVFQYWWAELEKTFKTFRTDSTIPDTFNAGNVEENEFGLGLLM